MDVETRYWELLAIGIGTVEACRAVGITCKTGYRWRAEIIDTINVAGVQTLADTAYQGGGPAVRVPQRRQRLDPDTGRYRRLYADQKEVNTAHAWRRGPGERANAEIKDWRVLRKIRSSPCRADTLVRTVQVLMMAG